MTMRGASHVQGLRSHRASALLAALVVILTGQSVCLVSATAQTPTASTPTMQDQLQQTQPPTGGITQGGLSPVGLPLPGIPQQAGVPAAGAASAGPVGDVAENPFAPTGSASSGSSLPAPPQAGGVYSGTVPGTATLNGPASGSVYPNQVYPNQVYPGAPGTSPASLPPLPKPMVSSQVKDVEDDLLGMTPDQIRALRRMVDDRQKAASEQPNPPKLVTGSVMLSLAPGSSPPVIRTFQGSISSFVVVDSTGAPWPVDNFIVGSKLFTVSRLDEAHGSAFAIETMGMYGQSNLVLQLAGMPTPATITLMAGQKELDGRIEVRVQGRGPNATITAGSLPPGTDSRLLPVLDGVPPVGGVRLKVTGLDQVSAWRLPDNTMVVRSPVRIVKPATIQFVSSADGTYVYTFPLMPRLLGIANGNWVDIGISW